MSGYKPMRVIGRIAMLSIFGVVGCATPSNSSMKGPANHVTNTATSTNNTISVTNMTISNSSMNSSNQTSVTNTTASSTSGGSSAIRFNTTVAQAMQYLRAQGGTIPLMAPTEPDFTPNEPYLAAQASVDHKNNGYDVELYSMNEQLPINSSVLSSPQFDTLNKLVDSFGGAKYPTSKSAKDSLYQNPPEGVIAPAYVTPPNVPATKVDLGNGIVGTAYNSDLVAHSPMVMWHEGDWTLQVWDNSIDDDVQEAKRIVSYLHTHLLPETYGVFGENMAGDGNHTSVEWVYGNTMYSIFDYRSGLRAIAMAASMRVYPSGNFRP